MADLKEIPRLTPELYQQWYTESLESPSTFWPQMANHFLDFQKPWDKICHSDFETGTIEWFPGAQLNVTENCLDRHLKTRADQPALIFEGDDSANQQTFTYQQLYEQVCQMANTLKAMGIKKGDRVCLYLPMIPMTAIAMLACARIGAIHSVVFGGFSSAALYDRLSDAGCCLIITADEGIRGGKRIPLKANVSAALQKATTVTQVLVIKNTGNTIDWDPLRDRWYHECAASQSSDCPPEPMNAEDPLFILYTSGSTGKPKGVLHTTAGYSLWAAMTFRWVFDWQDGERFWCSADAGWITGHTYALYGPLLNGATTLWFEGVPNYPTPARFWEIIDRHQINIFYTAPTAIRALMAQGDDYVNRTQRNSLRLLGTVGEPINPEAWRWYHEVVGKGTCDIVDTWWQTETGGIMIAPIPGVGAQKPGTAGLPFFGVRALILSDEGKVLPGEAEGHLAIAQTWPGQIRTVYNHHERFIKTYLSNWPGYFYTGDGASRDEDGDLTITGRVDDIINMSGHRIGTAEVESALVQHSDIAEAAVVGVPHPVKGQALYAFVTLMHNKTGSEMLMQDCLRTIEHQIGRFATTCTIQWCSELPKTRSGKIMRRILRAIAVGDTNNLGDLSTLAEPSVVDNLIAQKLQLENA